MYNVAGLRGLFPALWKDYLSGDGRVICLGSLVWESSLEMSGVTDVDADDHGVPEVTQAHQLLDFDWKLKYVVSSDSITSVNKPLLRLELAISKNPVEMKEMTLYRKDIPEEKPQVLVSEYSKVELDRLISKLESITQVFETADSQSK